MNLQPLYDVKERLEQAAIAGTGLLGEDFRLQRAAESIKPLAGVSPVFAKIEAGLQALLSAPDTERSGRLLDLLALVDAVAYTQGSAGIPGELEPLPTGGGTYCQISYGQLQPLLAALTSTGGGRLEVIRSAWENHPEWCLDFRVLPALVAGLGDSYGEIAELNTSILKELGPSVPPLLKRGFDPSGKKEMARRVEVISAIEGADASLWLREVLPNAKKDVRAAVILALGRGGENIPLLLDLTKSERGANRESALKALAKQDGPDLRAFWEQELAAHSQSVKFLQPSNADWANELVASGLRARLEQFLGSGKSPTYEEGTDLTTWCWSVGKKDTPAMLDFWRWADRHMEEIDQIKDDKNRPFLLGEKLTGYLRNAVCQTGPGPLRDFCLTLFAHHPEMTRYLQISVQAALLSRPAAEVFETYAPYILTEKPTEDADYKKTCNTVLLRALGDVYWNRTQERHVLVFGPATAEPLDPRWLERLIRAAEKPDLGHYYPFSGGDAVTGFDKTLVELANPADPEQCALLVPYLRDRMVETGSWYSYGQYLLRFGGSPRGVLCKAMKKGKDAALYYVRVLLSEASKSLPAEEVAELCQEALDSERFRPTGNELFLAKKVLPWTIEQLRAGKPYPEWDDWWKMRP